jgi:hypothetical protein
VEARASFSHKVAPGLAQSPGRALASLAEDEVSSQIKFQDSRWGQPLPDEEVEFGGELLPCECEGAAPGDVVG